jgi:hypothetical protein
MGPYSQINNIEMSLDGVTSVDDTLTQPTVSAYQRRRYRYMGQVQSNHALCRRR